MAIHHEVRMYPFSDPVGLAIDSHFEWLRENEPVSRICLPYGGEAWLLTRYADIKAVLTDRRFSRAAAIGDDVPRLAVEPPGGSAMAVMDPPEHTRLRKLVALAFTARRTEQLRPRTQEFADTLLARMIENGPSADLVEAFALPLPVLVICQLIGVPYEDRDYFTKLANVLLSSTAYTRDQVGEAVDELSGYLCDLIEEREARPADDLLSALVHTARVDSDQLSEQELVTLCGTLLSAGYENTANSIANFTFLMLENPSLLSQLREDRKLIPNAVEEFLRYSMSGLGVSHARIATEDIDIANVTIRKNEAVFVSLPSANHDSEVFTDPAVLDFAREHNNHIAFGHGIHHCLGSQLARMELQVALGSLLDRLPGLRLAIPGRDLRWKIGLTVRGPESLPVEW